MVSLWLYFGTSVPLIVGLGYLRWRLSKVEDAVHDLDWRTR